jgi:hypothetical protein
VWRFTATKTAAAQRKYTFGLPAGTRFDFQMQVDNADAVEMGLALLLYMLKTNRSDRRRASRGLGWCRLNHPVRLYQILTCCWPGTGDLAPEDRKPYTDAF